MKDSETILRELEESRPVLPPGFVDRVMAALPEQPDPTWRERLAAVWMPDRQWLLPATAGALAAVLVMFGALWVFRAPAPNNVVTVTLELVAPGAEQVELVGTFNEWRTGEILMERPEGDGPWRLTLELAPGRHEYLFLVDGHQWTTDPKALAYREDGFGNVNAVLEI